MLEKLRQAEAWLDRNGRPAWLGTMVVGFVLFWPIGLAVLGYMIWSGRMGCWGKSHRNGEKRWGRRGTAYQPTGNAAFDAYREATLQRLEEEREAFTDFLDRLRKAKDQAEFDQFMADRARPGPTPETGGASAPIPQAPTGGAPFTGPTPQPAG